MNIAYAIRDRISGKLASPGKYYFTDNLTHARFYDSKKNAKRRVDLENKRNPRTVFSREMNEWKKQQVTLDLEIVQIEVNIINGT